MNWVHPTTLVLASCFAAFFQSAVPVWLGMAGLRLELIPGLVVYGALRADLPTTAAVAIVGGLSRDALSSGPFGLGVLPLLLLGVVLHRRRELVLRDSAWAQAVLGGGAALATTLVLLGAMLMLGPLLGRPGDIEFAWAPELPAPGQAWPPVGWRTWVGMVWVTVGGLLATPGWFLGLGWVHAKFDYRPAFDGARQPIREMRRGRY